MFHIEGVLLPRCWEFKLHSRDRQFLISESHAQGSLLSLNEEGLLRVSFYNYSSFYIGQCQKDF